MSERAAQADTGRRYGGIRGARHARWLGILEAKVLEGPEEKPYLVHAWPESVWARTAPASIAEELAMTAAGRAAREEREAREHQQRVAAGIAEIYSRLDAEEFRALAGARGPGRRARSRLAADVVGGHVMATLAALAGGLEFTCTGHGRGGHGRELAEVTDAGARLELCCPACGRECRLGYKAVQRLASSGLPGADISLLPA
jgi:hypothetical protein